nr:neurogenin-1-like [Hydra vulgaris]
MNNRRSSSESFASDSESPPEILDVYRCDTNCSRIKRLRANDRERRRVHLINCAMESLRNVIPGMKEKRKITKLELLRAANRYIWLLDETLRTGKPLDEVMERFIETPKIYYPYITVVKREFHY